MIKLMTLLKFLRVLCLTAVTSAAPLTTITLGGDSNNVDTDNIVDRILLQLDGPIDAAIKAALGGASAAPVVTNFEGTVSQGPTVTVETSGTLSGESHVLDMIENVVFR